MLARAAALAGHTLQELASLAAATPAAWDPTRTKGLAGTWLERALGARAGSAAGPDFPTLGIELKSIPVGRDGRPRETTFVCMVPATRMALLDWGSSPVRAKLRRVLFVPIESEPQLPQGERRLGAPRLWSPSADEEAALRADFELLAAAIACDGLDAISARSGRYLHVRPKASHAHARAPASDELGAPTRALPRGFYLRPSFTARVLADCRDPLAQVLL